MNTIREQLAHWRNAFQRGEIDEPRLNAELLLAHVLDIKRGDLIGRKNDRLTPAQRAEFETLARRRLKREPVDYIIGERDFYGRAFVVRPGVLVPRPETETIVEITRRELPARFDAWGVDIGCGSGCLVVTLAIEFPRLKWIGVDVSSTALKVTRENAERFGVSSRIHLLRGDGLNAIRASAGFSLVVSNPPYIDPADAPEMQPEVTQHEPHEALFGGPGGVAVSRAILAQVPEQLAPGALALFEFGAGQHDAMREIALDAGLVNVDTEPDFRGIPRILSARA